MAIREQTTAQLHAELTHGIQQHWVGTLREQFAFVRVYLLRSGGFAVWLADARYKNVRGKEREQLKDRVQQLLHDSNPTMPSEVALLVTSMFGDTEPEKRLQQDGIWLDHQGLSTFSFDRGQATGFVDSGGRDICVGDHVHAQVTGNSAVHGDWCVYRIIQRGLAPALMYRYSQHGYIFPEEYTGQFLTDVYDRKLSLFVEDTTTLRPTQLKLRVLDPLDVLARCTVPLSVEEYRRCAAEY